MGVKLSESLDRFIDRQEEAIIDPMIFESLWTGMGCDVCGFGTVENVGEFDPVKPCPECGEVMINADVDEDSEK